MASQKVTSAYIDPNYRSASSQRLGRSGVKGPGSPRLNPKPSQASGGRRPSEINALYPITDPEMAGDLPPDVVASMEEDLAKAAGTWVEPVVAAPVPQEPDPGTSHPSALLADKLIEDEVDKTPPPALSLADASTPVEEDDDDEDDEEDL